MNKEEIKDRNDKRRLELRTYWGMKQINADKNNRCWSHYWDYMRESCHELFQEEKGREPTDEEYNTYCEENGASVTECFLEYYLDEDNYKKDRAMIKKAIRDGHERRRLEFEASCRMWSEKEREEIRVRKEEIMAAWNKMVAEVAAA
jgi:hypothetical protein